MKIAMPTMPSIGHQPTGPAKNAGRKLKSSTPVALPAAVVALVLPLAPDPKTAVIWAAESAVKLPASASANLTAVAPVKLVAVMTSAALSAPEVGVRVIICEEVVTVAAAFETEVA